MTLSSFGLLLFGSVAATADASPLLISCFFNFAFTIVVPSNGSGGAVVVVVLWSSLLSAAAIYDATITRFSTVLISSGDCASSMIALVDDIVVRRESWPGSSIYVSNY
jgi:hypothetical protein